MPILRLRNAHLLRSSLWLPNPTAAQIARLHSTPSLCEKWRNKWNSDVNRGQEPSKNHIRYATRQKRADAKKALKNLLYNSGSSNFSFQNYESSWNFSGRSSWSAKQDEHSSYSDKNFQPKPSSRFGGKSNGKKIKRKSKRGSLFEDDDDDQPNIVFEAAFGKRWYAWCFGSSNDWFHHSSSSGFEWRNHSHWKSRRAEEWNSDRDSKSEFDADSHVVGSSSDRSILGLPPRGPLKIEEVKKAFHLSALKWHPDKHQQPSQAMAEEKFKLCVNAYKSLCSALSPDH